MTHPSIQGLREATEGARCVRYPDQGQCAIDESGRIHPECYEAAQTAYLTEHGVGLFGEGLVPQAAIIKARGCLHDAALMAAADDQMGNARRFAAAREALVPVPQDGEM